MSIVPRLTTFARDTRLVWKLAEGHERAQVAKQRGRVEWQPGDFLKQVFLS
jgi:hypothetical protein